MTFAAVKASLGRKLCRSLITSAVLLCEFTPSVFGKTSLTLHRVARHRAFEPTFKHRSHCGGMCDFGSFRNTQGLSCERKNGRITIPDLSVRRGLTGTIRRHHFSIAVDRWVILSPDDNLDFGGHAHAQLALLGPFCSSSRACRCRILDARPPSVSS